MTYRTIALAIMILIGAFVTTKLQAVQEHPFLICKRSQFDELRSRATREPWASMKADAVAAVAQKFETDNAVELHRYVGACALAYILEPENSAAHAKKVRDGILMLNKIDFNPSTRWRGTVPTMGAAFVCTLALDIVYDDLTAHDIAKCEEMIETKINLIDRKGSWPSARYGTHGTWDIYKGLRTTPDDAFYDYCMIQMTEDGVSAVSPGYAFARMGATDDRPQKSAYADVLEFTGIDRRYYNNERFQKFYRWLFSSCVTPSKDFHMFGDASPVWSPSNNVLFWRVGRFDRKAAAYAAWLLDGHKPRGHILSYILMNEPLPKPVVPTSKLFYKGAAVFRERADSPMSLGAMLYNITSNAEWHTHEEVNAISCAAYGNRILTNGGWLGEPMRPPFKNNTIAINGQNHKKRTGAGITEGLLSDGLDYACGSSGEALGDDKSFDRSLILLHGQGGAGGYFVVVDEVNAAVGDKIHSYLQVATESTITEAGSAQEYLAKIDHHAKVDGVGLSVFYAEKPESVEQALIESGSQTRNPESGSHYRLEAVYPADNEGKCNMITLLFPYDEKHPKARIQNWLHDKIETGLRVEFDNGAHDLIMMPKNGEVLRMKGLVFDGKLMVKRNAHTDKKFYFACQSTLLLSYRVGFESTAPITLHMKGKSGNITSDGAEVKFYHPNITKVLVDEKPVEILESDDGFVSVKITAGQHKISLQ